MHINEYNPKQERAETTKNRILDAALALFSQKGFHGTNTKEIAAAAGLATGSVYRYFKDKKALFIGVCSRVETGMENDIFEYGRSLMQQGISPKEVLERMVAISLEAHHPRRKFHMEVIALQARDPEVAALVKKREQRIKESILEFFRPMASAFRVSDLKTAAELTHMVLEEAARRTVIEESETDSALVQAELCDMLTRYLFY